MPSGDKRYANPTRGICFKCCDVYNTEKYMCRECFNIGCKPLNVKYEKDQREKRDRENKIRRDQNCWL